ncbi:MAG: hypothetical protein WKF37_09880 [Bryobacteraceae bacterium]
MIHYTDEAWFDFVRNLLLSEKAAFMQRHLDEECTECRRIHARWLAIAETASRQRQCQPAESDVRIVKAAFVEQLQKLVRPKKSILATVIFDSFGDRVPVGFRTVFLQARHVLHQAGLWRVFLRVKTESGNRIFTAGHVTTSGPSTSEETVLQVTLAHANKLILQTKTNALGEFYFQAAYERDMQILVWISSDEAIAISLPDPKNRPL